MNTQLSLFATGLLCEHCSNDPGRDPRNGNLWNGFRDMDTRQLVCINCRDDHYRAKWQTDKRGLWSEFPVMVTV